MKETGQSLTEKEKNFLNQNQGSTRELFGKGEIKDYFGMTYKEHIKDKKNICINGEDPTYLSTKEQLKLFVQGQCSPIIMVPGMLGTKLQAEIDCEVLKS